jgi:hypothetical protein
MECLTLLGKMLDFQVIIFYSTEKKFISDADYCIIENYSNPHLLQHLLFLFGVSG